MNELAKINVNPGTILVVPSSRVDGGKSRRTRKIGDRALNGGAGQAQDFTVEVEIPDVKERQRADALVQNALVAIRRHATLTTIGYLTDADHLAEIIKSYSKLREATETFNKDAKFSRVSISFAPFNIGADLVNNEECAKALADHIRTELTELYNKLVAGDVKGVTNTLLRGRRMYTLATGTQADSIKFALEEGGSGLKALKDAIKRGETAESAGRALAGDGAEKPSQIAMIASAIETFTYAPELHVPELPAEIAGANAGELPSGSASTSAVLVAA